MCGQGAWCQWPWRNRKHFYGGREILLCSSTLRSSFVSAFATLFLPRFHVSVGSHTAALELMIPWLSPEC